MQPVTNAQQQIPETDWRIEVIQKLQHKINSLRKEQENLGFSLVRCNHITKISLAIASLKQSIRGY